MRYYIVDAFTSTPFGGNPAGVVVLGASAEWPSEELMQHIAAELRYSETAFVIQNGTNEFTTRYFTPCSEVPVCGHATLATFAVLSHEGVVNRGARCLNHTGAGDLEVSIGDNIMTQMAKPEVIDVVIDIRELHDIMGIDPAAPQPSLPAEVVSTGLPDIIMPVADVGTLNSLRPDMARLAALSQRLNVTGVHAFALSTDGYTAHVRNFGPLYGIDEESATGTANAALTHYLVHHGISSAPGECRFLQGEAMRRPSVITTVVASDGTIAVGGQCAIVAHGELHR